MSLVQYRIDLDLSVDKSINEKQTKANKFSIYLLRPVLYTP